MARRWSLGVKRVAGQTYRVIKRGGAWLVFKGAELVAMFIRNVVYTFSREVGKGLARKILAA